MPISTYPPGSLGSSLTYVPQVLQFGTSGRRGQVIHLTHLEIFINVVAELTFLQSLPVAEGGIVKGDTLFYAYDLRPSSHSYVEGQGGRGKLVQAVEQAIRYAGMVPVNQGQIPTPALTYYALQQGKGSIMITGSHIPFDRNGYKTNTSRGELLKQHEKPINDKVQQVRSLFYEQTFDASLFTADGFFKQEPGDLSELQDQAAQAYRQRYVDFLGLDALTGMKVLVYQHSAVGRDLLVDILRSLGAFVVPTGRSEIFVPIDTENIKPEQLKLMQALYDAAALQYGTFDAIVSTDGDSDRPLVLGIDAKTNTVQSFGGDLLGMITAEFLGADAVVVPISSNDAVDYGHLQDKLEPKTRIGSPFVIAGMEQALAKGKQKVCGWEANGGFLTGSTLTRQGKTLAALPTRDAVLPILVVLSVAQQDKTPLLEVFSRLPKRYGSAALLEQFPRTLGLAMIKQLSPADNRVCNVVFSEQGCGFFDKDNNLLSTDAEEIKAMVTIRQLLLSVFTAELGFSAISKITYIDGVRIYFDNQDIAHLRPSGNADELRIYAVANTLERAKAIASMAIQEPNGILRCLEHLVTKDVATSLN